MSDYQECLICKELVKTSSMNFIQFNKVQNLNEGFYCYECIEKHDVNFTLLRESLNYHYCPICNEKIVHDIVKPCLKCQPKEIAEGKDISGQNVFVVCRVTGKPGNDRVFNIWSIHETQEGGDKRIKELIELRPEIPSEEWRCHEMEIQK